MNDVNLTPSILGIASVRAGQTSAQREAGTLGAWSLNTRSGLEDISGDVIKAKGKLTIARSTDFTGLSTTSHVAIRLCCINTSIANKIVAEALN